MVERAGQYGGVWRRGFLGPADFNNYVRVVYDALARFSPDGAKIEPKIAAGWESSKDFKSWTVKLRKGAKWSDGAPFTADDIMFWYKDVLLNKDLTPAVPAWMQNGDGTPGPGREGRRPRQVRFTYKQAGHPVPHRPGQPGRRRPDLRRLPPRPLPEEVPRRATPRRKTSTSWWPDAGFKTWTELFAARNAPLENPERPPWRPGCRSAA